MITNSHIYRIKGAIQNYAWGGYEYLPNLLGYDNSNNQPQAEYWLGTHPKGTATLLHNGKETPLPDWLQQHPDQLGKEVLNQFGELPFLLKILDVRQMLSIQLHPTVPVAKAGFAKEETLSIPRLAPNRNYKDQNHKPEVMVALTDFWLLHGFQSLAAIQRSLEQVPGWQSLRPILATKGILGLYGHVMNLSQAEITELLEPLHKSLAQRADQLPKNSADFWAWRAFQQYTLDGQHDRGIFSVYWFNLVNLHAGEGIFQGAGIPHAYLEGVNVELMANSDNVLRGGLTPKHIDVPELLANIVTDPIEPAILAGHPLANHPNVKHYPIPVPDFELVQLELSATETFDLAQKGPAIFLVMAGSLLLNELDLKAGDAAFCGDKSRLLLKPTTSETVKLFVAFVDKTLFL